ncbi:MAG: histidine--tRNA ligase [Planctomycetota bacterium]|jgi:histidyl-tRNA synthetase
MARRRAPRGTEDLFPERIPCFEHIFRSCRQVLEGAGYGEIRTPMMEDTSLFVRSLGEVTDVVQKEMFNIQRGDTDLTFRPEGTAPVVRAYLERNLDKQRPFQKFFYMGPMFRFERPQAGRSRQFYQVGIEALGSYSPLLDAEVIACAQRCFEAMGLQNFKVHLNSIGDASDRDRYREVLKEYMRPLLDERCEDCHGRFERNVFRMLDCKVRGCQPSNKAAPEFLDHLGRESVERFEQTLHALDAMGIPYEKDPGIVRGFDYYTHTVFEVRCPDLGARDAICGGGRYDGLIADLGGPELGAVGFAIGVTPSMLALEKQGHPMASPQPEQLPVFVAPVSDAQREAAFLLADRLRQAGLATDTDFENKSLKALFKAGNKRGLKLMLMLGEDEQSRGVVKVKDFASGEEFELPDDAELAAALQARLEQG